MRMRAIATYGRHGVLVTTMRSAKPDEPIEMFVYGQTYVGPRNRKGALQKDVPDTPWAMDASSLRARWT